MPDSDNQKPTPKKPGGEQELSMEKRLLLAFALMGIVLFLTQYFFPQPTPEKTLKPTQSATPQQAEKVDQPTPTQTQPPPAGQISAAGEQQQTIQTNVYKIVFSNHGGVVRSWELLKYQDGNGRPLELVNSYGASKTHYPFSLLYDGTAPSVDLNQVFWVATRTADGNGIDFQYSNGRTVAKKSFRFVRDSYLSQVNTEILENGAPLAHLLAWRGGFGDKTVAARAANQKTLYFNPADNKLVEKDVSAAKKGAVTESGQFSFAGIEDTYFAAVLLPKDNRQLRVQTLSDTVGIDKGSGEEPHVGAAIGGEGRSQFSLFVGPKDLDLLGRVDPKLVQAVDFGWFAIIAKPLFFALNWVNDKYLHNYGWSIVVLTIAINFLLFPLKLTGLKGMRKMSALQPQINAINEKYKNVGIRDPRAAEKNQEIMDLYKKHGVNPLGAGCMPLLLQIPFFIAFYKVLSVAIEMRGASWLWVTDLSQPETLPIRLLPLIMIGTQFLLQRMTPATPGADPAQQKMMQFMPLMMGVFFYNAVSGLVLYWLTSNVVGIAQQVLMNRMMPPPAPPVEAKPAPSKRTPRK